MRVLDLFSGIGGFSLGLERAGMETVAFVEREPFCQKVLAKHWPEVPIYDDVTTYRGDEHECDVVCGGFPCQDISVAGKGAGLAGERSGLWSEMARIIGVARPRYVIVENVAALLGRGLGTVLGDLSALGYDAEWHCIPASAVGAPHRRDRVWIVAYTNSDRAGFGGNGRTISNRKRDYSPKEQERHHKQHGADGNGDDVAHAAQLFRDGGDDNTGKRVVAKKERKLRDGGRAVNISDAKNGKRRRGAQRKQERHGRLELHGADWEMAYADSERLEGQLADCDPKGWQGPFKGPLRLRGRAKIWDAEPDVGRVANGVPKRVDRLRSLGNAVVPQIPEMIGKAIMEAA